jgi:hypothetical protein
MKIPDGYVLIPHAMVHTNRVSVEFETVELVMCRSCKHFLPDANGHHCWIHGASVEEDDWCSWAEARGEE